MTSEELNRRFVYAPRFFIALSLFFHVSVVITWGTNKLLEDMGYHLFGLNNKKPMIKNIYQEFIQVDLVALPDSLMNQKDTIDATLDIGDDPLPQDVKKADDVEEVDPDSLPELDANADKLAEELKKADREKDQAAKRKAEADMAKALEALDKENRLSDALKDLEAEQKGKRAKLKGNILSKGTSTTGNIGNAKDLYESILAQRIKQHFNIYSWQEKKNLVSIIFIRVGSKGQLKEKRVLKPSRDPLYDSAVLQAVEDAQPLPVSRDPSLMKQGITIEFRPN